MAEPDPYQHWLHWHPVMGKLAITKADDPDYLTRLSVEELAQVVPVTCQYLVDGGWVHEDGHAIVERGDA